MKRTTPPTALLILFLLFSLPFLSAAEPKLETRAYDVRWIVEKLSNAPLILGPRGNLVFQIPGGAADAYGFPLFGGQEPALSRTDYLETPVPADPLFILNSQQVVTDRNVLAEQLTALQDVLDAREGFSVTYLGDLLQVRGAPGIHGVVGPFSADLKAKAETRISVDCLLVPIEALVELAPTWSSAGPYLPDEVFAKGLLDERSRLLSAAARSGQKVASGLKDLRALVVDQQINQTGVIPVMNPLVETPFAGDRIEVCPFILQGGKRIWLDLSIGRFRLTSEKAAPGNEWGDLELPVTQETLISTSLVTESGKVMLAGALFEKGGMAALIRATVRKPLGAPDAAPAATPAAAKDGLALRAYDATLLLRYRPARIWPSHSVRERFGLAGGRLFYDSDRIREQLLPQPADERFWLSLQGGWVFVTGTSSDHEAFERRLRQETDRISQVVTIDVRAFELGRKDLGAVLSKGQAGPVLAPDWEEALRGSREVKERGYSVTGVAGDLHALLGARIRTFVVGVSQVSGGTGFAIIERSDPETTTCGDGGEILAQAILSGDGAGAWLRIEGGQARITGERLVTASFVALSAAFEGSAGGSDGGSELKPGGVKALSRPAEAPDEIKKIALKLPQQAVQYWSPQIEVPLDREVILHVDAPEGETATLLVGRVRRVK